MRSYGKVESAFWQNPKVRKLTEAARLLLLYIYSTPHGNSVGCFVLPNGYIMEDIGWSLERVSQHVQELVTNGFIERSESLLRIVGWFNHNTIENANVAKAAAKAIRLIPNCQIKHNLINDISKSGLTHMEQYINEFRNALPKQSVDGFRTPEPDPEPEPKPPSSITKADARAAEIFLWLETRFNSPKPYIMAPVYAWLEWGADFERDILPAAERFLKRKKGPPGSLEWLDDDIAKSLKLRGKPMPKISGGAKSSGPLADQDYRAGTEGFEVVGGGAHGE